MAREFGFRRGALNVVNWVSDQYSQYGTKVVSVAEREAIHTLEAILHTQLPVRRKDKRDGVVSAVASRTEPKARGVRPVGDSAGPGGPAESVRQRRWWARSAAAWRRAASVLGTSRSALSSAKSWMAPL